MGKSKDPKRRTNERVLLIEKDSLLYGHAFKALTGSAYKLYSILRAKTYGTLPGACGEDIKLPYSILVKDTGLSIQTVSSCLIELENMGFIDLIERGGLKSGAKSCSIYRLSMRFRDYGTDKFKPGEMKKLKGVRRHCGFAVMHARKQKSPIKTRAVPLHKLERSMGIQ